MKNHAGLGFQRKEVTMKHVDLSTESGDVVPHFLVDRLDVECHATMTL